jgi:GT2 family glycosyltransferase
MCLHDGVALTRACLESLRRTREPFHVVAVDNASSDDTAALLRDWPYPFPLTAVRNDVNGSVIAAFNQGWRLCTTEFVCLLHNDTELLDPSWLSRMVALSDADPSVGLIGLYGARAVRRDGRFVGRTLVHGLAEAPALAADACVEVAVVDGVCLFVRRRVLHSVGGFDEGYGFFHGYDRDLSFAVRETGARCMVLGARFLHRGGGTRARDFAAPRRESDDLRARRAAVARFAHKFRHRLPCDVRGLSERVRDRLGRRTTSPAGDRKPAGRRR